MSFIFGICGYFRSNMSVDAPFIFVSMFTLSKVFTIKSNRKNIFSKAHETFSNLENNYRLDRPNKNILVILSIIL